MTDRARRPFARRRPRGAPTVVFVDDLRWDAFTQLSPRLRRRGVRTIRVSTERHLRSRLASRLLFDRHAVLESATDSTVLLAILKEEHVVDVQFVETLGDLVRGGIGLLDPMVADSVGRRLQIMDKLTAARTFEAAGVSTPPVTPVDETTPEAIANDYGFPIVAKKRVGCGGDNVVIAADLAALTAASEQWRGDADSRYYERFITGVKLNYAAAVSDAGIEQKLAYRVTRWMQPVGTATEIETIEDPQLMAFGRKALEVSGCTGLMNLDVMRDDDGVDWLIDFNARAFGGGANFLSVGLDVSEGYLRALGLRDEPPARRSAPSATLIEVFPTSLGDARNRGSLARMAVAFLEDSWPYVRWLGVRYWLAEVLRAPDVVAAAARSRHAVKDRASG